MVEVRCLSTLKKAAEFTAPILPAYYIDDASIQYPFTGASTGDGAALAFAISEVLLSKVKMPPDHSKIYPGVFTTFRVWFVCHVACLYHAGDALPSAPISALR